MGFMAESSTVLGTAECCITATRLPQVPVIPELLICVTVTHTGQVVMVK